MWKPTLPQLRRQSHVLEPTQENHGPQLSRKKSCKHTNVFAVTKKQTKKTTSLRHTQKNENERLTREVKSHFAYEDTQETKNARRAVAIVEL